MDKTNLDGYRMDQQALLSELEQAGAEIRGRNIKCPFHDDRTPSAGIYKSDDGIWRFRCHASDCDFHGDIFDVRAKRQGIGVEDVLRALNPDPPRNIPKPPPVKPAPVYGDLAAIEGALSKSATVEDTYPYTNPDTRAVDMAVFRLRDAEGKKSFRQASPSGNGFILKAPAKPWPLYNRARLRTATDVVVVEGEKDVHTLHGIGIVATTSPGGASNAGNADWEPLARKTVIVWPDKDSAGAKYAKDVAAILEKLEPPPQVYVLETETLNLPEHGDATDYISQLAGTNEEKARKVWAVMADAKPHAADEPLSKLIEKTIAGKMRPIQFPWPELSRESRALIPGTITLLCGEGGASKSFMLLECISHWIGQGIKCALYELEENTAYHLNRALAQIASNGHLVDAQWIEENPMQARTEYNAYSVSLKALARCMWDRGDKKETRYADLLAWIKARAESGCRIIAIDPVTSADVEKPYTEDKQFIKEADRVLQKHGSSLILVTHPTKLSGGKPSQHHIAGGAAWERHTQNIFWLQYYVDFETFEINGAGGNYSRDANRAIVILKSRNGRGAGRRIAFNFDSQSLRFTEVGVIANKKTKARKEEESSGVPF